MRQRSRAGGWWPAGRSPSIRFRMALWTATVALVIQLVLSGLFFVFYRRSINDLFDSRLANRASMIERGLASRADPDDAFLAQLAEECLFFPQYEAFIVAVYDERGEPVASTSRPALALGALAGPSPTPEGRAVAFRQRIAALAHESRPSALARVRMERLDPPSGPRTLLIATSDGYFETLLAQRVQFMLVSLTAGTLATALAAWLISGAVIAPLRQLRGMATAFNPEAMGSAAEPRTTAAELQPVERDLLAARERLRQAFLAQERFVSNVSHELNTPIAVILTEAQTLDRATLTPDGQRFVDSVTQEMRRLGRMVDTFLTLSRMRGGKAAAPRRLCDVNEFVMEAMSDCGPLARQRDVSLKAHLDDRGDDAPTVAGDAELLRAAVDDLVRNAIKNSPRGSAVHVGVARRPGWCDVGVRDRGPSVPDEERGRVFERFGSPSPAPRGRGAGLALAVAQGLAELHGGTITASTPPEGGCEFVLSLPLAPAPDAPPAEPTASAPQATPAH